jgi:FMN phosphatase YigB (HAD superfamily)
VRIAIDIDSTLHHHWPLVDAAARRRFGVALPYEEQFPWAARRLDDDQLRICIEDTHSDEAIAGPRPYPHAVETVNRWHAGHAIHVVSMRPERSVAATARWLDAIGLRRDELWCGDEKVAHCRAVGIELLIDDSPETLRRAVAAGIRAATLRHPWNEPLWSAPEIATAADWQELARVLGPVLAGGASATGQR